MNSFEYLSSFYSDQPFGSNTKGHLTDDHIRKILRKYSNKEKSVEKNNLDQVVIQNVDFDKDKFKNTDYVISSKDVSNIYISNDNGKLTASLV